MIEAHFVLDKFVKIHKLTSFNSISCGESKVIDNIGISSVLSLLGGENFSKSLLVSDLSVEEIGASPFG